ncbi:MAG TPA: hypothetical protein VHA52_08140 [Candidatus Babeliaceae bacterium]|nr:hypothetical protein [Candidatus Babeliaceae bacterium]
MKQEFSAIEKEMATVNLMVMQESANNASKAIAQATTAKDVKDAICQFWSQYGKYFKMATGVPFIGKFIAILVGLLDAICPAGN